MLNFNCKQNEDSKKGFRFSVRPLEAEEIHFLCFSISFNVLLFVESDDGSDYQLYDAGYVLNNKKNFKEFLLSTINQASANSNLHFSKDSKNGLSFALRRLEAEIIDLLRFVASYWDQSHIQNSL